MLTTSSKLEIAAHLRLMRAVLCERPGMKEMERDQDATFLMYPFRLIENTLRAGRCIDRSHRILGVSLQPRICEETVERHTAEQIKLAELVNAWVGICSVHTIRAFVDHDENRSLIIAAIHGDTNAAILIIDALRRGVD